LFLGIDLGGTKCRVAVFEHRDDTVETDFRQFEVSQLSDNPSKEELDQAYLRDSGRLITTCHELLVRHGRVPFEGIGIAAAGVVDSERTQLTGAGNIRHWVNRPVARLVREHHPRSQVILGNDAESGAMAEALHGECQGSDLWYVIWGTGVGGTLLKHIDGSPIPLPGELGHQCIDFNSSLRCGCGQLGCLEAYVGGINLEKRYGHPSQMSDEQWTEALLRMRTGIHNAVALQPVPLVIFGGGVSCKQRHRLPDLEVMVRARLKIHERTPTIKLSRFGETAGTVGALALLDLVFRPLHR
jgi:predicted NBD/HSP70 family sugar kinase